jgi:hypothetical protein
MPISVFLRFTSPRNPSMLYNSIVGEMRLRAGEPAPGSVYHLASVLDDGMFIADVWESLDAFKAFVVAKMLPLTAKRGLLSPEFQFGDVHRLVNGPASSDRGLLVLLSFEGDCDELMSRCDRINAAIDFSNSPPEGMIFHWSAKRSGGIYMVHHWVDRESYDAFLNTGIEEALRAAGLPQPHREYFDVFSTIDGRATVNR